MKKWFVILAAVFALGAFAAPAMANNVTLTPTPPGISGAWPHALFYSYYNVSGDVCAGFPCALQVRFTDYPFAGDYAGGGALEASPQYTVNIPNVYLGVHTISWYVNNQSVGAQACPLGPGNHWWGHRMVFQVHWSNGSWGDPHVTADSGGTFTSC